MTVVDLTQVLAAGAPHMPSQPAYEMSRLREVGKDASTVSCLSLTTHTGTHVDAPIHMVVGGRFLHDVPLTQLIGGMTCLKARGAPGEPITLDLLSGLEHVRRGDMVFIDTGWADRFLSEDYYVHPYLDVTVADWAVNLGCPIVGVDTLGPDLPFPMRPRPFDYPVHRRLLAADVLIIENLGQLRELDGPRHDCVVAPMRLADVDGAPCRVLAFPEHTFT